MELEQILEQMRREAREDHLTLVQKVEAGFTKVADDLNDHELKDLEAQSKLELRLIPLESLNTTARWLVSSLIAAFITLGAAGAWMFLFRGPHA